MFILKFLTIIFVSLSFFMAHAQKKDWESVVETMCKDPTEEDLKRSDCVKYFTQCVLKLKELPKAKEDNYTKFEIAYNLYEDVKVRKFSCSKVMK